MNRRLFLLLSVASACISPLVAQAAAFPDKPIRIIVPYAPGGTTDMLARVVGKHMSDNLGQSVIVENKPGANGRSEDRRVGKKCVRQVSSRWWRCHKKKKKKK